MDEVSKTTVTKYLVQVQAVRPGWFDITDVGNDEADMIELAKQRQRRFMLPVHVVKRITVTTVSEQVVYQGLHAAESPINVVEVVAEQPKPTPDHNDSTDTVYVSKTVEEKTMSEVWLVDRSDDGGVTWETTGALGSKQEAEQEARARYGFASQTNMNPRCAPGMPQFRPQQYIRLYPPVVEKPFVLEVPNYD